MAPPPSDPARDRRRQLRRALIGWIGGFAVLALFVLAIVLGGDEERRTAGDPAHAGGFLDYHLTASEFEGLRAGEAESAVLQRLGRIGLPEGETPVPIIALFPRHRESLVCSYWQITDAPETAARLCFSTPRGVLRQKLERSVESGFEGEQTQRA